MPAAGFAPLWGSLPCAYTDRALGSRQGPARGTPSLPGDPPAGEPLGRSLVPHRPLSRAGPGAAGSPLPSRPVPPRRARAAAGSAMPGTQTNTALGGGAKRLPPFWGRGSPAGGWVPQPVPSRLVPSGAGRAVPAAGPGGAEPGEAPRLLPGPGGEG